MNFKMNINYLELLIPGLREKRTSDISARTLLGKSHHNSLIYRRVINTENI